MKRRVVVTGMGSISPFGVGSDVSWEKLISGESCISLVESVDLSDSPVKIGGEVKWVKDGGWFDPSIYLPKKDVPRMSRSIIYGLISADLAMADSGLVASDDSFAPRCGVILGTGAGGMDVVTDGIACINEKGFNRLTPFFVPGLLCNLVCGHISIKYNFQGPSFAVVSACASGNHAIGEATRMIQNGLVDVVVSGGTESVQTRVCFAGFNAIKALSTRNEDPTTASRPYDSSRDGFVMSEGGACLILEEYEHAKKRGAKIYAEVSGYGLSSDANHITAPHPDGRGAISSMNLALRDAGLNVSDIGYINAHGTSTPRGDELEIKAIKSVFGDLAPNIPISSTKSATGHMLGAAAALEAVFCMKVFETGLVPATINLHNIDESCQGLNLVPLKAQEHSVNHIMSNAFGFGGCNATIIFSKV